MSMVCWCVLVCRTEPPREVSREDAEGIERGWAVELVERWRGSFVGGKLVRAGKKLNLDHSIACCIKLF